MMIPEYIRFYGYTASQVLYERAVTFFSLVNSMYRLQARETIQASLAVSVGVSGKDGQDTMNELKKQERGLHGIVQEVKIAKEVRNVH